jgi:hypothetical protein
MSLVAQALATIEGDIVELADFVDLCMKSMKAPARVAELQKFEGHLQIKKAKRTRFRHTLKSVAGLSEKARPHIDSNFRYVT